MMKKKLVYSILAAFLVFSFGCTSKQSSLTSDELKSDGVLQDNGQGICVDHSSGKMWQVDRSRLFYSHEGAQQFVTNLQLGGYSDWRLPTKEELFDLHNVFFLEKNGNCELKQRGNYWATDEIGQIVSGHWETYYLCGPAGSKYVPSIKNKGFVRAIRQ